MGSVLRRPVAAAAIEAARRRLMQGEAYAAIARELGISLKTVERIRDGKHRATRAPKRVRCACGALLLTDTCVACEVRQIKELAHAS